MANSTLPKDYLNLIERALMMGISDNLNKQIRVWDLPSGLDGLEDLTAAKLNAIPSAELPRSLSENYNIYLNKPLSSYALSDLGASSGGFEKADDEYPHIYPLQDHGHSNDVTAGDLLYIGEEDEKHVYEAKDSGADITLNEYNIGSTNKETLENLKAAIAHANGNPDLTVELMEYKVIKGNHPNLADKTSVELRFTNLYSDADMKETSRYSAQRGINWTSSGSGDISISTTMPSQQAGAGPSVTLAENVTSSDRTWTVSNASAFSESIGNTFFIIDKEIFQVSSVDTTANTIAVSNRNDFHVPNEFQTHSSGTSIKWIKNWTSGKQNYNKIFDLSGSAYGAYNNPPPIGLKETTSEGFHVYGAFPSGENVQFPAIVVQQVASGFEEKFFGDSVTFGSDTTTSSGEVYGMTFLIHIFTDEETIIPLGLKERYGQRRLTNWMMLNIANVIQGLDWGVYQEQELEVIERHLNQWRDIGYMPQAGWYGATAEFDIFFLNKR